MGLQGEILQFPLPELLTNGAAMAGAVEVKPQQIGFAAFPLTGFSRLFVTTGAPMLALTFHLLT